MRDLHELGCLRTRKRISGANMGKQEGVLALALPWATLTKTLELRVKIWRFSGTSLLNPSRACPAFQPGTPVQARLGFNNIVPLILFRVLRIHHAYDPRIRGVVVEKSQKKGC